LAAPRGLSQLATSFIGSWCQGIHRAPLFARTRSMIDRLDRVSESAGSCSIFPASARTPYTGGSGCRSIAIDSSSLLCSCPGTALQAHRLSSGAPTLRSVQPTTTGQPSRPIPERQKCGPPWPSRSNRRGPSPSRWTCKLSVFRCYSLEPRQPQRYSRSWLLRGAVLGLVTVRWLTRFLYSNGSAVSGIPFFFLRPCLLRRLWRLKRPLVRVTLPIVCLSLYDNHPRRRDIPSSTRELVAGPPPTPRG
jgi:hypothetical protein